MTGRRTLKKGKDVKLVHQIDLRIPRGILERGVLRSSSACTILALFRSVKGRHTRMAAAAATSLYFRTAVYLLEHSTLRIAYT
jgi:hypothetical protein